MPKENKHLKRNLLLISAILFLIPAVIAECDFRTFPSQSKQGSGPLFDSSWGNVFMVTPFLEDNKLCWEWTSVGIGSIYDGSGFDRPDICKFACDAKKDCDMLDGCSAFREGGSSSCGGSGSDECSHCIVDSPTPHCEDDNDCSVVKGSCTELSGTQILGEVIASEEDCFRTCKIEPREYRLEVDYKPVAWFGPVPTCSGDWHGIPYKVVHFGVAPSTPYCCPEGSDIEEIEVYPHTWGDWGDPAPDSYKIKKCVYPYGTMLGVTSFTIPDTDIDDGTAVNKDKIEENKWNITHPAFTLIETGNMPFEITRAYLSKSGDTYTITRIYKPQDSDREFIVNSDLVFNYNLLDTANELKIDAEHKYISMLRRDKYYVACDEEVCTNEVCVLDACSCDDFDWHVKKEPTYRDIHRGCGGESRDRYQHCWYRRKCNYNEDGDCTGCSCSHKQETKLRKRIEKETEFIEDVSTTTQHIRIPHVSHENILDNTKINVTGIINQFVDDEGNREISGTINVTLDPDILRMFIFQVNESTISYFPIVYPVKHYLYKKFPSPGDEETKVYTHHDSYGYERKEFDFNEVCKRECPSPRCWCPPDDRFDVTCINDTGGEFKPNTDSDPSNDCVCPQSDCYPDPCKSKRSFHEEQGIRIRNGEFEKPLGKEYKNWAVTKGKVTRVPNGFSGYAVKLEDNGWIKQRITPIPLHTFPYNELCFMYAVEECKSGGYLKLYVNGNEKFKLDCNSYTSPYCDLPSGWNRECVEIEDEISSIEFRSNNIKVYLDNVNLGEYYDFVGLYTENRSSMKKYFDIGFKDYDFTGFLTAKANVRQNQTDHKTTYTFDFNTLKISIINSTGGLEEYTLTAKDIEENANITIYSHFRNITIDLFPSSPNPNVNVILREASKIDYEFDTEPWNIKPGEIVTGRLTLTYYDTGIPIRNQPIYIESGSGKVEFLSPPSLINDGYVTTDANGVASFTFKIHCFTILYFYFPGTMVAIPPATNPVSPANAEAPVGSTEFRSPFFHGEFLANFLILILILIFILFSYRLFKRRRTDFGEWWKTLKGEE